MTVEGCLGYEILQKQTSTLAKVSCSQRRERELEPYYEVSPSVFAVNTPPETCLVDCNFRIADFFFKKKKGKEKERGGGKYESGNEA